MAFNYSQAVANGTAGDIRAGTARDGPELAEAFTKELGFIGVNGEVVLKLFPRGWDESDLPPSCASLLAVASSTGILAAAGPDDLAITSTNQVREVLSERHDKEHAASKVRDFHANTRIPRAKLRHVAFTADESALIVSGSDGGIDAYKLQDLVSSDANPVVQISTSNTALRALAPNPASEHAELVAVITDDGELLMANLKNGALHEGPQGAVLTTQATCVSWSNKGKQLVVGLADGTAIQMKPDGTPVVRIPKTTALLEPSHVSAISWLQNDTFMVVYTPQEKEEPPPPSEFFIIDRQPKTSDFTFRKLPDAVTLFGQPRYPTSFFINRLREFPPSLKDLLIVSATSSEDIGLIAKSDKALSKDEYDTNDFVMASISDDARKAVVPLGQSGSPTSPVGMAIDLSSSDAVMDPIPEDSDHIFKTPGGVPQLIIVNTEGNLCSWWLIYSDSVRNNVTYPGIGASVAPPAEQSDTQEAMSFQQTEETKPAPNPFAAPSSTFGKPSFGAPASTSESPASGFGSGTGFGKPSVIGPSSKSSWTSTGFGNAQTGTESSPGSSKPAFGAATSIGGTATPAFGTTGFGQPAFGKPTAAPAFGQTGFGSGSASNAFGAKPPTTSAFGNNASTTSGFASFAGKGGFGGTTDKDKPASPFGQKSGQGFAGFGTQSQELPAFGQPSTKPFGGFGGQSQASPNLFGQKADSSSTTFGKPSPIGGNTNSNPFGQPAATSGFGKGGSFKLGSTFKGDGSAKDDLPKPSNAGGSLFGSNFENMLPGSGTAASEARDKEESMSEEVEDNSSPASDQPPSDTRAAGPLTLVTPPSTIGQSKATPAPPVSSLFGSSSAQSTTPQPPPPASTGWSFGNVPTQDTKEPDTKFPSTTPKAPPAQQVPLFGQKPSTTTSQATSEKLEDSPKIKTEPASDNESVDLQKIPEAPLPPDAISKERYVSGDTSASSTNSKSTGLSDGKTPEWTPANASATNAPDHARLPDEQEDEDREGSEDEGEDGDEDELSGFEGSEEDVEEGESSGAEDASEDQIQTSPESSFKSGERSAVQSPTGGIFTKVSTSANPKSKQLFGEIGNSGPILPPPKPQQSPRSPSPLRQQRPTERLRSETSRSVSAPVNPAALIDRRRQEYAQSGLATQTSQSQQDEAARLQQQQERATREKHAKEALELQELDDDEDELIRNELQVPLAATDILDDFLTYQAKSAEEGPKSKSGIPAQIERLYRDINSMIITIGLNSRALGAYLKYQQEQPTNRNWPDVLLSDSPENALNGEWHLGHIDKLFEGQKQLEELANEIEISDVDGKLEDCQKLLSQDIHDLRTKFSSVRKMIKTQGNPEDAASAPLSAEQVSIQHDLRKASIAVQSKLVQVEEALAVLRVMSAELSVDDKGMRKSSLLRKKPTVGAVTNTVMKMTRMAEQRSAEVDILESQMKKLDIAGAARNGTPTATPNGKQLVRIGTPNSAGSVYLTPDSKLGGSTRSTPFRSQGRASAPNLPAEDVERFQIRAQRKKEVAALLKSVLLEKQAKGK
jgi:nucleoporin NUP159